MKDLFRKSAVYFIALFLSFMAAAIPVHCEELPLKEKEALSLSLEDAICMAIANNRDIKIQEEEVAFAKTNITSAQSKFFPQASIGYGFTYNDAVVTTESLPNNRKDTRIFYGYKSNNQLALNGSQMVYDGGASIANLKQARVQLKIQEATLAARKLEIEFEAKRLFYGLLLAYETMRINKYLVDQAQAHYENVRNKYEQGTSSRFDALQSKVQVSKLIPALVQAQNSIEVISNDLKKLLYLDMGCAVKLKENLRYLPIDVNLEEFLNEAYKNSPEMRLKILGVDLEKWDIERAKSGWYPNINATGNYTYTSDKIVDMINPRHDNWDLGLSASFSIFDGMSTLAKVKAARSRYSQAVLSKENIIEQIVVDIRRGCLDLKESHAVILSQKDSLAEAKDALNISYIGYDNGVMINLDVIDAQVSLSQVEKNLAGGIYDYLMAQAFLDKVMGREFLSFYLKNSGGVDDKKG
ncbi:MAG: TolC family protein [Candidatus Omnitrophota bacterium]|nr:TolC family protein [Candidatus Omnitrophota bacterium]